MIIRPKTKRRLLILLVILVTSGIALSWLYAYRMRIAENKFQLDKQMGMDAYRSADYPTAVNELSEYIDHEQKRDSGALDPEALLAYANARAKVPSKDIDYIGSAIRALQTYCSLVPENMRERDHLVEMEAPYSSYGPDALARANDILKADPNDQVALKAIAEINVAQHEYQEASAAADRCAQLAPTDLEMQELNFHIMQELGRPASQMQARADALRTKYPADPRFLIVKAWAYYYGQNPSQSPQQRRDDFDAYKKLILQAARQDPPNDQFAKITVGLLDHLGQFSVSQDLLCRAATKFDDPELTVQMVLRQWEAHQYQAVVSTLKNLDPTSSATDPQLIALKALALYSLNDNESASALVAALAARGSDDHMAAAWATTLKAQFASPPLDLKTRLARYQEAQLLDPRNGYIAFLMGDVYAQMDETDLALKAWRQACAEMPSWSEPHVRLALLLVDLGQGATDEAARAAEDATLASTNANGSMDLRAAIANIKVSYARLPTTPDPTAAASLLDEVKQLQTQVPNEPETLPIYVSLLLQTGQRASAIDVIKAACENAGPQSQNALMSLVTISRNSKLGLEDKLYAAIDQKHATTPQLAYARAMEMLGTGNAAQGLALLIDSQAKDPHSENAVFWQRAICQYREASSDPGAATAWKKLGNAYPDDAGVQNSILTVGQSIWSDRPFIKTTIDRLKALTGDQAIGWKTAYARWLLSGNGGESDASQAVVLLTDVISSNPGEYLPHLLLATAYDKLNKTTAALDEWRKAAALQPQSAQAQFNLFNALAAAGRKQDAMMVFDQMAQISNLPPDLALATATIVASQGDLQRAERMLLAYPKCTNQVLHDATLAKVYRLENQTKEAAAIYANLIQAPHLDAGTIRDAADFFGATGQTARAKAVLGRLDELPLSPAQRDLILAGFEEGHGTAEAAAKLYQQAVEADGTDASAAIAQIEFLVRRRDWNQAQNDLSAALTRWPDDNSLKSLQSATAALSQDPHIDELGSLIEAVSTDPRNPAVRETVPVATSVSSTTAQIEALLDKYPGFEPLYDLATQRLVAAGQRGDAAAMASREMNQFPQSVDAARKAAEINAALGNWNDALVAARQWRQRIAENPFPADIFIARADMLVDQPQPQDAIDCLAPYLANAKAQPDQNQVLLTTYAQALIREGRESEAADMLLPLAKNSARWRLLSLAIAPIAYSDGAASGQWIQHVLPLLDAKSLDEHVGLAKVYLACAENQNYTQDYTLAAQALQPFLQTGQMNASQWITYASAASGAGDSASAEPAYRQALKLEPKNAIAANNLADLLRHDGDAASLREGYGLVTQAIADHPGDPHSVDFFDTLARILLKQGRVNDAISAFEKGYSINPRNLSILIGLTSTYASSRQFDTAVRYLSQIDSIMLPSMHLSSDLQAELDTARQTIRKSETRNSVSGTDLSPIAR